MATTWINAGDLLDGRLPDVCATSGLPADTTVPQDIAVLASDEPRRGRRVRLDLRMLLDHWIDGGWLDRGDRWTTFRLPHSWDARQRIEGRAAFYLAALFPATVALAHGATYANPVTFPLGALATLLVVVGWSLVRAQRLRVMAFDGQRYLVSGVHRAFARAMEDRARSGSPPPPIGSERLRPTT